jgi:hypothetical protein
MVFPLTPPGRLKAASRGADGLAAIFAATRFHPRFRADLWTCDARKCGVCYRFYTLVNFCHFVLKISNHRI